MLHTDLRVHGVHFDYRTKLLIQDHFVIDTDALKKIAKVSRARYYLLSGSL